MGVLTHELTQLRDEILALRSARRELLKDLTRSALGRRAETSQELARFSRGFAASSKRAKADRCGTLSDLRHSVSDLLGGIRSDLKGIRQTWLPPATSLAGAIGGIAGQVRLETAVDEEATHRAIGSVSARGAAGGQKPLRKKRKH